MTNDHYQWMSVTVTLEIKKSITERLDTKVQTYKTSQFHHKHSHNPGPSPTHSCGHSSSPSTPDVIKLFVEKIDRYL